eukprot:3940871-Rhodomonas_salina.2
MRSACACSLYTLRPPLPPHAPRTAPLCLRLRAVPAAAKKKKSNKKQKKYRTRREVRGAADRLGVEEGALAGGSGGGGAAEESAVLFGVGADRVEAGAYEVEELAVRHGAVTAPEHRHPLLRARAQSHALKVMLLKVMLLKVMLLKVMLLKVMLLLEARPAWALLSGEGCGC